MNDVNFANAHRSWENSWVNGPNEDPINRLYDKMDDMDLDGLMEELYMAKANADELSGAKWIYLQRCIKAIEEEISKREEEMEKEEDLW